MNLPSSTRSGGSVAEPGARREEAARRRRALRKSRLGYSLLGVLLIAWFVAAGWFLTTQAPSVLGGRSSVSAPESIAAPSSVDDKAQAPSVMATAALSVEPTAILPPATIAWQPSHQGDTGYDGWREYEICGDLMERTIASLPEFAHVRAVTLEHGLTGSNSYQRGPSNTEAFDIEIALANDGAADAFISLHNDGGAPSGVLGMCMPDDAASRALTEQLVASVCAATGLPNRGIREERLYSLEGDKNQAELRLLLEIGDNVQDRALLENPESRQVIAEAIAEGLRSWVW